MTCLANRGSRIIVPAGLGFWEPIAPSIIAEIGHISQSTDYPLFKINTCAVNDSCYGGPPHDVRKESMSTSTSPAAPEPNRWAVLALLGVAQLMVVLDATIVNIALPSAQRA